MSGAGGAAQRRVGCNWKRGVNTLPTVYARWRRGDRDPELYVSTKHFRFWVAFHEGQIEANLVFFAERRKGEAPFSAACRAPGLRWVTETFYEFTYDGATPGEGEWYEDETRFP